ncbi:MAG: SDR family NAD(P)-dependent oxidoreductase [Verrucomicrobia bacterium]|nr:SDR family NAD(P)-dependent oxidoreductase [Verrucomicrobiota bacterium]
MQNRNERIVVVTGGGGGIGQAAAQRFAEAGAKALVTPTFRRSISSF